MFLNGLLGTTLYHQRRVRYKATKERNGPSQAWHSKQQPQKMMFREEMAKASGASQGSYHSCRITNATVPSFSALARLVILCELDFMRHLRRLQHLQAPKAHSPSVQHLKLQYIDTPDPLSDTKQGPKYDPFQTNAAVREEM